MSSPPIHRKNIKDPVNHARPHTNELVNKNQEATKSAFCQPNFIAEFSGQATSS
jgi:hypothetical protein